MGRGKGDVKKEGLIGSCGLNEVNCFVCKDLA